MVIMKFRHNDDKHTIYKGREALRERGIRVANDLTKRQRKQLNEEKAQGKLGYFYKGKLQYYTDKNDYVSSDSRDTKRRKLNESNHHSNMETEEHENADLSLYTSEHNTRY